MNEFIFTWNIENFSYSWQKKKEEIVSPTFVADTLQNTAWSLKLCHSGNLATDGRVLKDYFTLYLIRGEDDGPTYINCNYELSCVTANNLALTPVPPVSITGKLKMDRVAFFRTHEIFGQRKSLFLPQDTLMLRCRIWKHTGGMNKYGQCFGRTRLEIEKIVSVQDMNPGFTKKITIPIHSKNQNKLLLSVDIFHEEDGLKVLTFLQDISSIEASTFELSATGRNVTPLNCITSWLESSGEGMWAIPFSKTDDKTPVTNKLNLRCEYIYLTGYNTNSIEKIRPCSFKFPEFPSSTVISCIPSGKLADCPSIYKDLWDLYSKQILCDVELKTKSASFWVHKFVLCARSPVFLAMFTGEMKEKTNNCVEIEDLENHTLEKFLAFLYTDNFEESEWNTVTELYYAADKYQVERLKFFCCSYFENNADVSNVCDLLMLAEKHCDSHLKSTVEYYILKHHECIFSSSTWVQFSHKQPLLALSIMLCKYSEERSSKKKGKRFMLSSYSNALEDFRYLYQNQTLSDIVIQTTSASFPACKTMVCAGSSTLRELLVRENAPTSLEMYDLEVDTVSRLLLFLYTDSLGDMNWTTASNLYHAAIVYQIERLKIKCSCFFLENLIASNAAHLMKLAHEHRDFRLKSLVSDFISLRYKNTTVSAIWTELNESYHSESIEMERRSKRFKNIN